MERSKSWFDRVVRPETESITEPDNDESVGNKMMAKMGFTAGSGLGKTGHGMQNPIEVRQLEGGSFVFQLMMVIFGYFSMMTTR